MTYLEGADFFVRLVDLPPTVNGICSPNDDGTYNIYLNSRKDFDHQLDGYDHECDHIEDDDFYGDKDIRDVEGL